MSLTIIEQLDLVSGTVKPPSELLSVLVHQASFNYAKTFYDSSKDTSASTDATAYANKVYAIAKKVLKNEPGINAALTRMIITIIGASAYTYAQVSGANDDAWAGFILDQMDEAFEYLGDVRQAEKTAYTAL